jgi:hypothetical protein
LTLGTVRKCNNPTCTAACGDFFHEDLAPEALLRGVKCTICGGSADQHRKVSLLFDAPVISESAAEAVDNSADIGPEKK